VRSTGRWWPVEDNLEKHSLVKSGLAKWPGVPKKAVSVHDIRSRILHDVQDPGFAAVVAETLHFGECERAWEDPGLAMV
jgi:hypothetical protein